MKQQKHNLQEAKQKLEWQYRAGVLTESQYETRLRLIEDEKSIGNKLAQAYKKGPEATVNFLNQTANDSDLKKILQAPKEDGKEDDDDVGVGNVSGKAMSFLPTQSEIDLMKSVSYPLGSAKALSDAIVGGPTAEKVVADAGSKIIIDGHHRWSGAIGIGGGKAQISGTDFKLPGSNVAQKLAAAQILIVAKNQGGEVPAQGEAFKTNILGKNAQAIAKMIMDNINKQTDKGAPGPLLNDKMMKDLTSGDNKDIKIVLNWLGNLADRVKPLVGPGKPSTPEAVYQLRLAIALKVGQNLEQLPQPASGSPDRKFMPQFDDKATPAGPKVDAVKDDAAAGKFNIAPPFVKESVKRFKNSKNKGSIK